MAETTRDVHLNHGEVAINEGGIIYVYGDTYFGDKANEVPPIKRAVMVARLRRLADMLDGGA